MAKQSTVYSMFGLETPQEVAARERERAFEYLAGQRTGYQQAGAGIGLLLKGLFGGESEAMQRSKEGARIIQEARAERGDEGAMLAEAEADARQRGMAELAPEQRLRNQLQASYDVYNRIADRLESAGFLAEAQNARAQALDAGTGLLSLEKELAQIELTKAKTESELTPDAVDFKNVKTYQDSATGEKFLGGRIGGKIYNLNTDPPTLVANAIEFTPGAATPISKADVGVTRGLLLGDEEFADLSIEDQTQASAEITARVDEIMRSASSRGEPVNQADATRQALAEMKEQGRIQKRPWWQTGFGLLGAEQELVDQSDTQTITTQAQYDALPSGATYVGADGNTYRKP